MMKKILLAQKRFENKDGKLIGIETLTNREFYKVLDEFSLTDDEVEALTRWRDRVLNIPPIELTEANINKYLNISFYALSSCWDILNTANHKAYKRETIPDSILNRVGNLLSSLEFSILSLVYNQPIDKEELDGTKIDMLKSHPILINVRVGRHIVPTLTNIITLLYEMLSSNMDDEDIKLYTSDFKILIETLSDEYDGFIEPLVGHRRI